jgi:hypothetical protein
MQPEREFLRGAWATLSAHGCHIFHLRILKNDLKMILIREHVIKSTGIKGSLVQGEGIESLRAEWVPAVRR